MRLKGICYRLIAILVAIAMVLVVAEPLLAGLKVSPVSMEGEVSVGENTLPAITVTNTDEDKPMRVKVEVMGFGQNQMGTTIAIEDDTSPCSAVSLIKISPEEFDLKPRQSKKVRVSATIPPGATGGKYATIVVEQVPEPGMLAVGQVVVILVLTVAGSPLHTAGQIMGVDVQRQQPGGPLTFITSVSNQGDVHVRPIGDIVISKQGQEVGRVDVEPHLILPGYTRPLKTVCDAPGVKEGTYSFEVALDIGGTELAAGGSFTLSEAEGVVAVEGGVGEPGGETIVPEQSPPSTVPEQTPPSTPETPQPTDWRLIGEIAGGTLILGLLIFLFHTRRRRGYRQ